MDELSQWAIALRLSGQTYEQIATQLGIDRHYAEDIVKTGLLLIVQRLTREEAQ